MKTLVMYRWIYHCQIRNRMVSTPTPLPEDLIKHDHPDAVAIEGTRKEISLSDNPESMMTSSILRNAPLDQRINALK